MPGCALASMIDEKFRGSAGIIEAISSLESVFDSPSGVPSTELIIPAENTIWPMPSGFFFPLPSQLRRIL
jgi:hypothetical protein